jgi:lycopene beta-cyclase
MSTKASSIIIAGTGLSGLTLAVELSRQPFFRDTELILIDRDTKQRNDRTWCFWATPDEPLPPVLHHSWDKCLFYGQDWEKTLDIAPFRYHMIRGSDFYGWAKSELAKNPRVRWVQANIQNWDTATGQVFTDQGTFAADWIFNSAITPHRLLPKQEQWLPPSPFSHQKEHTEASQNGYTHLLQHFKGWIIQTPTPAFPTDCVTFMDYRLEQHGETRFVYVLPLSEHRALVEFTIFSPALCTAETYDTELEIYLRKHLNINSFHIEESEFGIIPMSDFPFTPNAEGRLIHIGTAGGFVKASSGYAFKRTQRKIRQLVQNWPETGRPNAALLRSDWHYRFFDSIMLRVLHNNSVSGEAFFTGLFRQLPAPLVFRFLDEDAKPGEIFRLLCAPPTWPFLKTALRQMPMWGKI